MGSLTNTHENRDVTYGGHWIEPRSFLLEALSKSCGDQLADVTFGRIFFIIFGNLGLKIRDYNESRVDGALSEFSY